MRLEQGTVVGNYRIEGALGRGGMADALIRKVTIHDREPATRGLHDYVVPTASKLLVFVAGYWMETGDDAGCSVALFDSEDSATAAIARPPGAGVKVESLELAEIVAQATA